MALVTVSVAQPWLTPKRLILNQALIDRPFDLSAECAGFARDLAKVEDQVRFLTWTLTTFFTEELIGATDD